jgi:PRTRC genetic system protein A
MRFLMGADGLYLETQQHWGSLVKLLWHSTRKFSPLPYGKVEEHDEFLTVMGEHVMPIVSEVMIPAAARAAEEDGEWAGFVVWDGSEFLPWEEEFKATVGSVEFLSHGAANLPAGMSLVADIHSHGRIPPFFSGDDNLSDKGRVKISIVLGNYRIEEDKPIFDWIARYCVNGFFFSGGDTVLRELGSHILVELEELEEEVRCADEHRENEI